MSKEEIMKQWDEIRSMLLSGEKGTLPREMFESIIDELSPATAYNAAEEVELPLEHYEFDGKWLYDADLVRQAIAADRASRQVAYFDSAIYQVEQHDGDWCDCDKEFFEKQPEGSRRVVFSRQVANKADVEPVGVIVADDPVHGWHMHALKPWNEIGAGTKLYATPPATTGASTVLTDERIGSLYSTMTGHNLCKKDMEACILFARAIERETLIAALIANDKKIDPVAAQAGQVAVPEPKILQFLTDVVSAAGLLSHGKRDKGLARRIADRAYEILFSLHAAEGSERQVPLLLPEQAGWIDKFGNVWPITAYSANGKPNYHDAHKRDWQPLYRLAAPSPAKESK